MRKTTQKRFENYLQDFYYNLEFTQEEKNELYQMCSEIELIGKNMVICMKAIRSLIFAHEKVFEENVDYLKTLKIDYSSRIFTNKLIRQYSFDLLSHILIFAIHTVSYESMMFFENKNPELWAKKMVFYKSKLKKVCINNTCDFMMELLDKLYRISVTLHYDLEVDYTMSIIYKTRNFKQEDVNLFNTAYDDNEGNNDHLIWLSDYLFSSQKADKIITAYELALKQKEEKKHSKKTPISTSAGS